MKTNKKYSRFLLLLIFLTLLLMEVSNSFYAGINYDGNKNTNKELQLNAASETIVAIISGTNKETRDKNQKKEIIAYCFYSNCTYIKDYSRYVLEVTNTSEILYSYKIIEYIHNKGDTK